MKRKPALGEVRPTTGKVLESLVGTLAPYVVDARVLDLFAGNGTLGLALLHAGAAEVTFVEGHARVAGRLKVPAPSQVVSARLPGALTRLEGPYQIIVGDPPYGADEGLACLPLLPRLLDPQGIVAWEHHHKDGYADQYGELHLWRRRRFGETAVSYYRLAAGPEKICPGSLPGGPGA